MRFHRALILGLLASATAPCARASERYLQCETEGSSTTCVVRTEVKGCERNALIAYGLSMPHREAKTRTMFSKEDLDKAEPLADTFKAYPESDRPRAFLIARGICLTK